MPDTHLNISIILRIQQRHSLCANGSTKKGGRNIGQLKTTEHLDYDDVEKCVRQKDSSVGLVPVGASLLCQMTKKGRKKMTKMSDDSNFCPPFVTPFFVI